MSLDIFCCSFGNTIKRFLSTCNIGNFSLFADWFRKSLICDRRRSRRSCSVSTFWRMPGNWSTSSHRSGRVLLPAHYKPGKIIVRIIIHHLSFYLIHLKIKNFYLAFVSWRKQVYLGVRLLPVLWAVIIQILITISVHSCFKIWKNHIIKAAIIPT